MIVRTLPETLELITQPDHAQLARRVMTHCVPLQAQTRRAAILEAIGEHDNGWAEVDAAPSLLAGTGQVADFISAPIAVRQGVWPRAVGRLSREPWVAALVAQHAITAYDRFRDDPDWAAFFARMTAERDQWRRATGLPFEALLDDYWFLRLADLISLAFCTGGTTPSRVRHWTVELVGTRVRVTPDVFGGATIPMTIAARTIPHRQYDSDEDLRRTLARATTATLHGEAGGE